MRTFNRGDVAFVADREGAESQVSVMGQQSDGSYLVVRIDGSGHQSGSPFLVANGKLLAPKGAFFDIRGEVLTTSSSHPGEVGQIVGTATSKSERKFFNVSFNDGSQEWLSEDHVFIDDEVKQAYDEAQNDGQFFK